MEKIKLATVIPVFNDWEGISDLLQDLDQQLSDLGIVDDVTIFIVDDGSTRVTGQQLLITAKVIKRFEIIKLGCNLGHQRAIAIGLSEVVNRSMFDAILILDGDGEDKPSDAAILLKEWQINPKAVVVARRRGRHEGPIFQASYKIYCKLFQLLSGRRLDFGNFAVLSNECALRLVHMPELWNHFAATLLRSRLPLVGLFISKGRRSHGHSKMNFVSLVNHGLSAAAVLVDVVFARILIFSTASAAILISAAIYVLHQKLFTSYAIPGWASSMVGLSLLGLLQLFALVFVAIFLMLSSRNSFHRPTLYQAREYIHSITVIDF